MLIPDNGCPFPPVLDIVRVRGGPGDSARLANAALGPFLFGPSQL